jgi:hypothetical protein
MLSGCIWSGCGLDSIGNERAAIVEQSKAIALKVVDAAKIDQSNLEAGGNIKNPAYDYIIVAGTGFFSYGRIQAIGVEIEASVRGAGLGTAEFDADMRERIFQILQRRDIADTDKQSLINEAVADWIRSRTANPTSQTE